MNKKGFLEGKSFIFILVAIVVLIIALSPWLSFLNFVPFTLSDVLVKILIAVVGVLLLFDYFGAGFGGQKFFFVIIGIILCAYGVLLLLEHFGISFLPFSLTLPMVVLQIILIAYAVWLLIGAFLQQ